MSYSISSIDCLAVKLNKDYFEALKKDISEINPELIVDANQKQIFEEVKKYYWDDEIDPNNYYNEFDDIEYYDNNNYAYCYKLDIETGTFNNGNYFEGYIYPISSGSRSIYEPEFKDKEDLIERIKGYLYIPREFDLVNNIIFLTGVNV